MAGTTCCCRCIGYIFSAGLSALFLWLSLRPSGPTISIEDFTVPALNATSNQTTNNTLIFHLKLRNNNKEEGVHYDALNLTFYRIRNLTSPVAIKSINGFYQGHKKKANRHETVEAVGVDWEREKEAANGTATGFRVDLKTAVRYKIVFWNTKRHRIAVGANLTVDSGGKLDKKRKKKGVKLSCAPVLQLGHWPHVSLLSGLLFILLCF